MLDFVIFVWGIISGMIISFMVEENRRIQRLKGPKTYTLEEAEALLGLTTEKEGQWINGVCSECGEHALFWSMSSGYCASNYCPNCGAKMEENK